jgi:hypothetical protein
LRALRDRKLRGSHLIAAFELPAKMRGLFEAEIQRDFLYGFAGEQQAPGHKQAPLVQPILRCAMQTTAEMPLQLSSGYATYSGKLISVIVCGFR